MGELAQAAPVRTAYSSKSPSRLDEKTMTPSPRSPSSSSLHAAHPLRTASATSRTVLMPVLLPRTPKAQLLDLVRPELSPGSGRESGQLESGVMAAVQVPDGVADSLAHP